MDICIQNIEENYKSLLLTIKLYRTVSYDVGHNLQQLHGFIEYKGQLFELENLNENVELSVAK